MPSLPDLIRLLTFPNETLSTEYKSWLPLSDNEGKAKLAKAAIALANHGGGVVVLGMRPDNSKGGELKSEDRPTNLQRYNQDDINSAINKFADPVFHCELVFAHHSQTNVEHAFVVVPAGLAVPVMSKRDCPDIIAARRCYVRKPGPKSEEPHTGEEWRKLLDRCVQAGRENMLEAIRAIIHGHSGSLPAKVTRDLLKEISDASRLRFETVTSLLPEDDPARFPHGYRAATIHLGGVEPVDDLAELRHRMEEAAQIRLTGWHPFPMMSREALRPRPYQSGIEAWIGNPADERARDRAAHHCDFWRAEKDGKFFIIRGYDEDDLPNIAAGKLFDVTIPIWRVGEVLLYAARIAKLFGDSPTITARFNFTGLRGRRLGSHVDIFFEGGGACLDDAVEIEVQATAAEIQDNLAEVLHPVLKSLYERFDFFELPMSIVAEELARMQKNRF